jgi:hypothetical protein
MNRERLQQMVTMLRGLLPEKRENFDIGEWTCGTSACAVGTACFHPWFNEQGLHINDCGGPEFDLWHGWHAVEQFFELSSNEARDLFCGVRYPSGDDTKPDEVADRIESFLKEAEVTA